MEPTAVLLARYHNLDNFNIETPTLEDDHWDIAITYAGHDSDDDRIDTDRLAALTHNVPEGHFDFTLDRSPYTDVPVLYVTAR